MWYQRDVAPIDNLQVAGTKKNKEGVIYEKELLGIYEM